MIYVFDKTDQLEALSPLEGLEIREVDSPELMAALGKITLAESRNRFAEDNKAFVAFLNEIPAAFGWMAMGKATIGELSHEFILPLFHRYLWNFRTLPEFRGLGIYPRLLQHILLREQQVSECIWIMHAPENTASAKGIKKAGFRFVGEASVVGDTEVIITSKRASEYIDILEEEFGFMFSESEPATCWNCSSPFIRNGDKICCCKAKGNVCNAEFIKTQNIKELQV